MTGILACIDGSIYSQSVCEHAAWAGRRTSRPVEVLHALGRREVSSVPANLSGNLDAGESETLLAELSSLDAQRAKLAQKRGRLLLDDAKARIEAAGAGEVTVRLRNGDIVDAVAQTGAGSRLVVIGKRGEAADFASLHLGSNLERVVRASSEPVLVAARAWRPIRRFLLAYDGGPSASRAVDLALGDPLLHGLECHLLMAGNGEGGAGARLEAAAARLRAGGFEVQARVEPGDAEDVIARAVEEHAIDLLVMGAYGHSRIRALIIGSTTTALVRSCRIPVLLVR
ncbi:universal stress protein [Arenibaculum sp.]|uniref:universal stress protein n=1 Tax=Arenibaculum sp. TaxID=2865862 RepID=UPI002E0D599D|nr:universal stress protein [Arenibaculum sp.]